MTHEEMLWAATNPPDDLPEKDYPAYLAHILGQFEDDGEGEETKGDNPPRQNMADCGCGTCAKCGAGKS